MVIDSNIRLEDNTIEKDKTLGSRMVGAGTGRSRTGEISSKILFSFDEVIRYLGLEQIDIEKLIEEGRLRPIKNKNEKTKFMAGEVEFVRTLLASKNKTQDELCQFN